MSSLAGRFNLKPSSQSLDRWVGSNHWIFLDRAAHRSLGVPCLLLSLLLCIGVVRAMVILVYHNPCPLPTNSWTDLVEEPGKMKTRTRNRARARFGRTRIWNTRISLCDEAEMMLRCVVFNRRSSRSCRLTRSHGRSIYRPRTALQRERDVFVTCRHYRCSIRRSPGTYRSVSPHCLSQPVPDFLGPVHR